MSDEPKLLRQSTLESTRLFFMTEMLGANTRFSVCFCNRLVFSDLCNEQFFWRFAFGFQRHKTCLIEVRYMVFRATEHARSKCKTYPDATRNMPNGAPDVFWGRSDLAKRAFSHSISRKIPTQLFNQKYRHAMPLHRPLPTMGWGVCRSEGCALKGPQHDSRPSPRPRLFETKMQIMADKPSWFVGIS